MTSRDIKIFCGCGKNKGVLIMGKSCDCRYCKWRRKEISDKELIGNEIEVLKDYLETITNMTDEEFFEKEIEGCDWSVGKVIYYLTDEIDCLFETKNDDKDRSEASLLLKEMGGDDLINKIQETFEKRWEKRK